MDNIEDILRALASDGDDDNSHGDHSSTDENQCGSESNGGIFGDIDPEMLFKMFSLFETLNSPSDNERFLLALRPMLREENRSKIDSAVKIMKLLTLLPVLKESGMLGKLL